MGRRGSQRTDQCRGPAADCCGARPVAVRILPNAEHQLPAGTGWQADLAYWIASPPQLDADDITGVEPASPVGVSSLPASGWYLNPILHMVVSLAVAILVFAIKSPSRRPQ